MEKNNLYLNDLFKNPKTKKEIFEAFGAPVGSTKRDKARIVLTAYKKRMDGQGGAADPATGVQQPQSFDPSSAFGNSILNNYSLFTTPTTTPTESSTIPAMSNFLKPAPPADPLSFITGLGLASAGGIVKAFGELGNVGININAALLGSHAPVPKQNLASGPIWGFGDKMQNKAATMMYPGGYTPPSSGAEAQKETTPQTPPAAIQQPGAAGAQTPSQGKTNIPWSINNVIQQKFESDTPSAMIPSAIMADPEARKNLALQMGIPEGDITAATLSGTIDAYQTKLMETSGLNDLQRERMTLAGQGAYLTSDLEDYIRGRDTYVKDIDNMIDQVNTGILRGQTSNDPETIESTKNYLNSLYLLKGQQNKRYMDLVNTANTKYNADVADLDNRTTSLTSTVNTQLQSGVAIRQEEYNNMYNALISAIQEYSTLASADGWGSAIFDSAGKAATSAVEGSQKIKFAEIQSQLDPIFKSEVSSTNSAGNLTTDKVFDPTGLATKVQIAKVAGRGPMDIAWYLSKEMQNASLSGDVAKMEDIRRELLNLSDSDFGYSGMTEQLVSAFDNAANKPLASKINTDIDIVREAVTSLQGSGIKDASETAAIEEWKAAQDTAGLDRTIRDSILKYYLMVAQRDPENLQFAFSSKDKPIAGSGHLWWGSEPVSNEELAKTISSAIQEGWMSDFINQ